MLFHSIDIVAPSTEPPFDVSLRYIQKSCEVPVITLNNDCSGMIDPEALDTTIVNEICRGW